MAHRVSISVPASDLATAAIYSAVPVEVLVDPVVGSASTASVDIDNPQ